MQARTQARMRIVSSEELSAVLERHEHPDNRREHLRVPARLEVEIALTGDELRRVYTDNLSRGGFMFTVERPLTLPETVECSLVLPDGETVQIVGEVRHVAGVAGTTRCEVGVQFKDMPEGTRAAIESSIAGLGSLC